MAYRKDYLHRDRRPPPPYSKHKQGESGLGAGSSSPCGDNDSKLPTELFQDMCKKIASLTKVVCDLTNKLEDQEFLMKQMKQIHQTELQHVESESKKVIEEYKLKIDALEARLLDEKRQRDQREEEFQILRRICNFTETFRPLKNSLKTKEPSPSNAETPSDDIELCNLNHHPKKRPVSACLTIESMKPTLLNGLNDIPFITHKHKDSNYHIEEIKCLLDICEKLREEKLELQSKYDSEMSRKDKETHTQLHDLQYAVGSQTTAISELKAKLEKQELQYRKRIGELLQHLSQSENRAEKHVKHIKQLEFQISAKEKQVSAMKSELSKTVELLKQSKEANNRVQAVNAQQSEKIMEHSDEIRKLEDQSSLYSTQLLESNLTIKELQCRLSQLTGTAEKFPPHPDDIATQNKSIDGSESEQIQMGNDALEKENSYFIEKNLGISTREYGNKELADSHKCCEEKEKALMEELGKTRQDYEKQVEDERIVHVEIQDNLEQQIDLLHSNLHQVLSTESEELNSLRNSLEEKSLLLIEAQKESAQLSSLATGLESKLRQRDEEFSKLAENLKQTQKLNLVEKLQGAMAKCLPSKEIFASSLDARHLINKTQKFQDGKDDNTEPDHSTKTEHLDKRIQALESTNLILLKNQNTMKRTHQAELYAQSEAHKKDLSKTVQTLQATCKEEKEILRKQYDNQTVSIRDDKGYFQRKFEGNKIDVHKRNIDALQKRLQEMQNRVVRREEDIRTKQIQTAHLAGLVEKLKQEKSCLLLSQVEKIHTVKHQASQQIKNLENYWQERLTKEIKVASQTFEKEKQKLTSQYSKDQRLLKDKISLLQSTIFASSMKSDKERPLPCLEFKKLHDVIGCKDSQIRKLQEEKESLLTELAARRGRSSSFHSTHMLVKSSEMTLCLKKPRLERPPLTPQLVRRHSLASHSEDKWFRARSQSPLNGIFSERIPVKHSFPETSNHRSSWTGDSIDDLLNCAMTVSNEVKKMSDEDNSPNNDEFGENEPLKDSVKCQTPRCESELQLEGPSPRDQMNTAIVYTCDTIVECDEHHSVAEENKHSLPSEKLSNITRKLLK